MQIEFYEFGKIRIGNDFYERDVVIFPDRVFSPWTRKQSHYLNLEDLENIPDLFKDNPEAVIIGTGYSGFVRIDPAVEKFFKNKNIEVIIDRTINAWKIYNEISPQKKTVAIFHLTC